ncbi:TetR/AcrR family transcriptional regulator C-terminal domain-containing protein [Frigoribacterium sp. ACAM 257]|uniref:TetR/AcrR family transcriptional regulator C-terminal domain-containing protein n=1 Tax=Frigoribacterium sp. ACAM 257 TaxID=2508998 RepID=UPI001CB9322B|nr:TetR/AcrR family transcriptional regulator C-terminal domain-containing protein [Frigoribacterium sp. ACAM 257]
MDRKTLHYHVDSRATLLQLVAADTFRDAMRTHDFVDFDDWQTAVRSFAHITRDAVNAAGAWAGYVAIDSEDDLESVRPAEIAVERLVEAGLPVADAGRAIAMIAVLAFSSARDQLVSADHRHPQEQVLKDAIDRMPSDRFGLIRRLLGAGGPSLGSDEQFDFELRLIETGITYLLEQTAPIA